MKNNKKNNERACEKAYKTDFVLSSLGFDSNSKKLFEEKEKKILSFAETLGFEKIVFCYNVGDFINLAEGFDIKKVKKIIEEKKNSLSKIVKKVNLKVSFGLIINSFYKNKTDFLIGLKKDAIILLDCFDGFDRDFLEKIKPNILFNLEFSKEKDFIHQRNSGINEAIAGFMKKNDVVYGISIKDVKKVNKEKKNLNLVLGRIYQNVKLIQDFSVQFNVFSMARELKELQSPNSMQSFIKLLGFNTKYIKNSILSK